MAARRSLAPLVALLFACAHAGLAPGQAGTVPAEEPPQAGAPASTAGEAPPAPSAAAPESPSELTLMAVGDVMLGSTFPEGDPLLLPPDDGASELAEVAPILSRGDLAFGNLEGPLLEGGNSAKCRRGARNCYAFRVPTRYGRHLKEAGFKVMSLANNHALDFGPEGRESSMKVLDDLGIAHSGQLGDVARITVKDRRVVVIAFAPNPGCYNLNDLESARKEVAELAAAGDLVVVSFHGGGEGAAHQHVPRGAELFLGENRGDLRTFTHAMVDAGASLLLGSGPHVVRGMEIYRGRLIAYSLGNFATYGKFNLGGPNGLSLVLEAHLAPDGTFRSGKIHPVRQSKPGGPHLDPGGEIIGVVRDLSVQDFGEAAVRVGADGSLLPPEQAGPPAPGA